MRKCFICNKEFGDDMNFCSVCGANLTTNIKQKWYYSSKSLVVSFLFVGPFMLPLIWTHPELTKFKKIIYSAIILVLSYFIFVAFLKSFKTVLDAYNLAGIM